MSGGASYGALLLETAWSGVVCVLAAVLLGGTFFSLLLKASGPHKLEYTFLDYSIAVFVEAVIVCLIFGNAGSDPSKESFLSNMVTASGVRCFVIVIGGACIGIANQMTVQGASIIGQLAPAISIGIGTVLSTYWTYLVQPAGDIGILTAGVVCLALATVATALSNYVRSRAASAGNAWDDSFRSFDEEQREQDSKGDDSFRSADSATDAAVPAPPTVNAPSRLSPLVRGVLICVASGTISSGWSLCAFYGTQPVPEGRVGVFTQLFYFQLGNMLATAGMCVLTLRKPLTGSPAPISAWLRLPLLQHLKGFGTGCWNGAAFCLVFASGSSPFPPVLGVALFNLQPIVALLMGVFVLRELRGAPLVAQLLVALAIALFIAGGIAFVSPLFFE
jgi:hypothetical protein